MKPQVAHVPLFLCMAALLSFLPARADDSGLPALLGAEEVQNAASARLVKIKSEQRQRLRPRLERAIDDVQRVTHLPRERLQLLRLAVECVIEHAADDGDSFLVSEVESLTKGISPRAAAQVLPTIKAASSHLPEAEELLGKCMRLRQVLTPEEFKHWQQVVADRQAYQAHAITVLAMMQVQCSAGLSDEQKQYLQPLMEKAVADYLPDVMAAIGAANEDIYFNLECVPVFLLGIEEKDARAFVPPGQWSQWQASAGAAASEWSQIKLMHDNRVGKAKP